LGHIYVIVCPLWNTTHILRDNSSITREPHELALEGRREDGVPIRDDGLRKTMEADNLGKERLGHRFRRVGCARGMKWQYLLQRSATVKMTDFPPT
jgi:hypothetical protein